MLRRSTQSLASTAAHHLFTKPLAKRPAAFQVQNAMPNVRQASTTQYERARLLRSAVASGPNGNPSKLPISHKPPKRRLEAASAPLRNNPAPTRGPILQCIANTTAGRYDLVALGNVLKRLGVRWYEVPEGDRERAIVIGPWKGRGGAERLINGKDVPTSASATLAELTGELEAQEDANDNSRDLGFEYGERGEIWVFNNGSYVTWGLTEEEGHAFLRDVIRYKGARIEADRLPMSENEIEEVDFVVDPTATTLILGNLVLLGRPPALATFPPSSSLASLLARYTLSLSLARSSSLSVLENRLDKHLDSVSRIPEQLEKFGVQPMGRKDVIRKIGELMSLRMAVNMRGGGLNDTPEFYWSEPELETYFDSIATEFEMKERIEAINKKIDYFEEVQTTLRALMTESSAHRMELIIIALIAVEVVLAIIREGPELWEKFGLPFLEKIHSWINPAEHEAYNQRLPRRRVQPAPAPQASPVESVEPAPSVRLV